MINRLRNEVICKLYKWSDNYICKLIKCLIIQILYINIFFEESVLLLYLNIEYLFIFCPLFFTCVCFVHTVITLMWLSKKWCVGWKKAKKLNFWFSSKIPIQTALTFFPKNNLKAEVVGFWMLSQNTHDPPMIIYKSK